MNPEILEVFSGANHGDKNKLTRNNLSRKSRKIRGEQPKG